MCVLPVFSVFKIHVNSVHGALLLKYVETNKSLAHLVPDNLLFPFLKTLFKRVSYLILFISIKIVVTTYFLNYNLSENI